MSKRVVWRDIFYAADVKPTPGKATDRGEPSWVDFELHEITELAEDDSDNKYELIATGQIKWDGCMNFEFNQSACMLYEAGYITRVLRRDGVLHGCGRRHMKQMAEAFDRLYDEAEKIIGAKIG